MNFFRRIIYFLLFCNATYGMDVPVKSQELPVQICICDRQGHLAALDYIQDWSVSKKVIVGNQQYAIVGIFGGRKGEVAAKYAAENLEKLFISLINTLQDRYGDPIYWPENIVKEGIEQLFGALDKNIKQNDKKSGTSALVMLITNSGKTYISWAGDARAVVFDGSNNITLSTKDHVPESKEQRKKLQPFGLATSRGLGYAEINTKLGEYALKNNPDLAAVEMKPGYSIIVGTAGFFEKISNDDLVCIKKGELMLNIHGYRPPIHEIFHDCKIKSLGQFVQNLRDEAFKRGSTKNISVGLITFTAEPIQPIEKPQIISQPTKLEPQTVSRDRYIRLKEDELKIAKQKLSHELDQIYSNPKTQAFELKSEAYFKGEHAYFEGQTLGLQALFRYKGADLFQIKQQLAASYKIHLMPTSADQMYNLLNILFEATKHDKRLQEGISALKFFPFPYIELLSDQQNLKLLTWYQINSTNVENIRAFFKSIKNELVFPFIVIYASPGHAQYVLDKVKKLLGKQEGLGITPRYNAAVTSLIYYAQGNSDDKKKPGFQEYFEQPNMAFYVPWFETVWDEYWRPKIASGLGKENTASFGEVWNQLEKNLAEAKSDQHRKAIQDEMDLLVPEIRNGQQILQQKGKPIFRDYVLK